MLERMSDFFENRLDGYDEHMLTNIESSDEFYPFTAKCLPTEKNCRLLDLGCGTGLELEEYFPLNPSAAVTGIDLSQGMLSALKKKFANKNITLISQRWLRTVGVCRYGVADKGYAVFLFYATLGGLLRISS
ncbi:MAG: methyltransferase domain-containing protein [Clostridiales bacterium]|nr:methyltransferase domain-containing protein [Clostridiales bacterium]